MPSMKAPALVFPGSDAEGMPRGNLACWYKFDENAGTAIHDYSGRGYNATAVGTATWENGGLKLITDGYVNTGVEAFGVCDLFCEAGKKFSIVLIAKGGTSVSTWLARAGAVVGSRQFQIYPTVTVTIRIKGTAQATTLANDGTPMMLTYTWDGTQSKIRKNLDAWYSFGAIGAAAEEAGEFILLGAKVTAAPDTFMNGTLYSMAAYETEAISDSKQRQIYLAEKSRLAQAGVVLP
jgi:hypothetical protein